VVDDGSLSIVAVRLDHEPETFGWRVEEHAGRRMLPDRLLEAGIRGPAIGELQRTGSIEVDGRRVGLEEVSEHRPGQRMALVMDTGVCDAAVELASQADLVVCEATFSSDDVDLARRYRHLTAADAGRVAREAGAQRLVLTHFSQRYPDTRALVDQAAAIFPDVVGAEDLLVVAVPRRRDENTPPVTPVTVERRRHLSGGDRADFIRRMPKAELHLHIEGTLEPEMMFELAARNQVGLPYADVEDVRRAYVFDHLQSFLDIYYAGCAVLVTELDFYELALAYVVRAAAQGVTHAEVFFDPQTHTDRGVPLDTVISGVTRGLEEGSARLGVTWRLIMCFLRHLGADAAMVALDQALPFRQLITAVGLDSSELGHPPAAFEAVFRRAEQHGMLAVAHAGEEGPPDYIWQALDILHVRRVDHGVRCWEDQLLVERLAEERVPLTVCPLSNVRLGVFPDMAHHNLAALLRRGLVVTVNSDDPAYFGGYVADNMEAAAEALGLEDVELLQLARHSFTASFLSESDRDQRLAELDRFASGRGLGPGG
jgi:adenosine deaminase